MRLGAPACTWCCASDRRSLAAHAEEHSAIARCGEFLPPIKEDHPLVQQIRPNVGASEIGCRLHPKRRSAPRPRERRLPITTIQFALDRHDFVEKTTAAIHQT